MISSHEIPNCIELYFILRHMIYQKCFSLLLLQIQIQNQNKLNQVPYVVSNVFIYTIFGQVIWVCEEGATCIKLEQHEYIMLFIVLMPHLITVVIMNANGMIIII